MPPSPRLFFFFFNDTATTEIYTLSLHDALPIYEVGRLKPHPGLGERVLYPLVLADGAVEDRSEEHTSELQSPDHLVCRLLLEKKKNTKNIIETGTPHAARHSNTRPLIHRTTP